MSGYDMTHRMEPNACVRTSVHGEGAVFLKSLVRSVPEELAGYRAPIRFWSVS